MNKWNPFYALEGTKDEMEKTYNSRECIERKYVSQDKWSEIEEYITKSYNESCVVEIEYYKGNRYVYIHGVIKKIDILNKKIVINNTDIKILDIYNISVV